MNELTALLRGDRSDPATAGLPLTADVLCQTYAGRVFKFAQLVSKDSAGAEDLAQDALERAIRGLRTFDPRKGEIEAWLWRIVVNAGRDAGRIEHRQRIAFELLADRWTTGDPAGEIDDIRKGELLAAVRGLSPRHRAVIALRFGADLPFRDVGRALGVSEAAALMSTRRALTILRDRLSRGATRQ